MNRDAGNGAAPLAECADAGQMQPRALLRELVDRCIADDCDLATAAKLLQMRRATLAEYVRHEEVRRLALRRLMGAFYVAFPECDPRLAVTARYWAEPKVDDLLRGGAAAPCMTYTAEEAMRLPPSQSHIRADGEMAPVSYNTNRLVQEFIEATRPQSADLGELPMCGVEFDFTA